MFKLSGDLDEHTNTSVYIIAKKEIVGGWHMPSNGK